MKKIEPQGGQGDGGQYSCKRAACGSQINSNCPGELQRKMVTQSLLAIQLVTLFILTNIAVQEPTINQKLADLVTGLKTTLLSSKENVLTLIVMLMMIIRVLLPVNVKGI
ncbi:hypothetical protein NQ314_006033 [Rhamnusium bicolor]|uniref:Uncharacterized protein n=1 Tax=Rhamnusium bicolor TaxID=1586634 RepID=A0AAV8ZAY0_9CUCU|nr:hypothetical protein NQ314_006033 [Rhamnusium bicolor]